MEILNPRSKRELLPVIVIQIVTSILVHILFLSITSIAATEIKRVYTNKSPNGELLQETKVYTGHPKLQGQINLHFLQILLLLHFFRSFFRVLLIIYNYLEFICFINKNMLMTVISRATA